MPAPASDTAADISSHCSPEAVSLPSNPSGSPDEQGQPGQLELEDIIQDLYREQIAYTSLFCSLMDMFQRNTA